jgi:hypothetical protein
VWRPPSLVSAQVCAVLKHEQGDTSREKGLSSLFPLV